MTVPAVAAATVVLRDGGSDGGLEVCLLERSARAGFVAGAHVFPGGVLDPADAQAADVVRNLDDAAASRLVGVPKDGLAFWSAAARECLEEAGVLPGLVAPAAIAPVLAARRRVHAGELSLADALGAADAHLDGRAIRCVARWVTPTGSPRRYDTRFFVAIAPVGAEVVVDGVEIVSHRWVTPTEALAANERGDVQLIFPTVRTLAALCSFRSARDAFEGLDFGDPAVALMPDVISEGERLFLVVGSDPEGNGGVYDWATAQPVATPAP